MNREKIKKGMDTAFVFLLLLLCLGFLFAAGNQRGMLHIFEKRAVVMWEDGWLPDRNVLESQREKGTQITVWNDVKNQMITAKELEKNVQMTVMEIRGTSNILFDSRGVLDEDSNGECILSEEAAKLLFGGTDIEGLEVTYEGESYRVKSLIPLDEAVFVYEATNKPEQLFEKAVLRNESAKDMRYETARFIKMAGGTVLDYQIYMDIMDMILFSILLATAIVVLFLIWKIAKRTVENRKEKLLWYGVWFVILGVSIWMISTAFSMPLDMIPPKWSDFEFYHRMWKEKGDALAFLAKAEKSIFELRYMDAFEKGTRCVRGMVLCAVACWGTYWKYKHKYCKK